MMLRPAMAQQAFKSREQQDCGENNYLLYSGPEINVN
jgi:hypothetical protein